jgi:hypothetical protein
MWRPGGMSSIAVFWPIRRMGAYRRMRRRKTVSEGTFKHW